MDKYMHADRSDLLAEAIPESLKNMLLVMDTAGIFQTGDDVDSQLWRLTWDRIDTFLPHLKEELFKPAEHEPCKLAMDREETPTPEPESAPLLSGATPDPTVTSAAADGKDGAQILGSQPTKQSDIRAPVLLNSTGSPVHSSPINMSPAHSPVHMSPAHSPPGHTDSPVHRDPALINYPMNRVHQI